MGIDYIDPADDPDEPRLPRPPDGPSPEGSRSPDTAPPPLPDAAERDIFRRAYQDLVAAAYADCPQGTSDTTDNLTTSDRGPWREALRPPGTDRLNQYPERPEVTVRHQSDGSWSGGETWQLLPEQNTEATVARANSHDEGEQAISPATPQIEATDPSRSMTGLEHRHKGEGEPVLPGVRVEGRRTRHCGAAYEVPGFHRLYLARIQGSDGEPRLH